ncbi:caspase Dronc-like isoform X2 [Hyposmocoma kahamanoa]|uniref:caspase Dronc-like isoform X2 n=1 Tax=Hyposmocoma kahamanoa TaxID=1477025 RepID=UPI000E6D81B0|nr:caspase Dronc-like isoform X2 [Hyposmocoma kahamanoa]
MQKEHRDRIQMNFSSLVEQTDLDLMVTALYEKGVFSELMIEPYKDNSKDARMRKRLLYIDITRRGPEAFCNLLDALSENGYWDLVRDLDPSSSLHARNSRPAPSFSGESKFYSLSKLKKTGKEPHDPNKNLAQHSSSSYIDKRNTTLNKETNGNAERELHVKGVVNLNQNSEIPHFNVIKSTKFVEDNESDIKLYRTRGRNRGVLVLFSYVAFQFGIEDYRHGACNDAVNLRYLFTELGFKVLSYSDLDLTETQHALSKLREGMCGEGPETVFVVFSSHGYARSCSSDTDLRCSDGGLISRSSIINYFNNDNFPELNGVPKVFVFQTCRGDNNDLAPRSPEHMPPPAPTAPPAAPRPPSGTAHDGAQGYVDEDRPDASVDRLHSDILIAHATVPGYVSNRDVVGGSWYIQALCDVFAERAHDCHVEKLFTLVDERLKLRFGPQTSSVDRWGFNKRLYLHPGLYED